MSKFLCTLLLLSCAVAQAHAWGAKGHRMAARVAARALPATMPAFFRESVEPLAYLCPEPDRWRGPNQPHLTATTAPDHFIFMESVKGLEFPATRYEFILMAAERGLVPRDRFDIRRIGTAFYAIVEEAERLTTEFRLLREAQETATPDAVVLRQIEANIIFSAGVLAHYITDTSQPLHTSAHISGWAAGFANPRGYASQAIHRRFETDFVEQAIEEKDIAARLAPARAVGDWRSEAEAHLRRSNEYLEQVYLLDQRGEFGSGKEPAEAKAFTAERLAAGAAMLRDAWQAAWQKSGDQLQEEPVRLTGAGGRTVLDLLGTLKRIETKPYEFGTLVTAIGNRRNGDGGRYWVYTVNGKMVSEAADRYKTSDGDRVEWRFARH